MRNRFEILRLTLTQIKKRLAIQMLCHMSVSLLLGYHLRYRTVGR